MSVELGEAEIACIGNRLTSEQRGLARVRLDDLRTGLKTFANQVNAKNKVISYEFERLEFDAREGRALGFGLSSSCNSSTSMRLRCNSKTFA
jgi:hypothetical protein